MALDPTIPLGAKAPPGIDIMKWAQLRNLATANALTEEEIKANRLGQELTSQQVAEVEARIPGVKAQSEQLAFNLAKDKAKADAAKNAIMTDKDGNVIMKNGVPEINFRQYQYNLYKSGLGGDALDAEAKYFANKSAEAKATGDYFNTENEIRNHLAVAAKAAYDQTKGSDADKTKAAQIAWEQLSKMAINASKREGQAPLNEAFFAYTPGLEQTLYTAQITPGNQEALKQGQQHINLEQQSIDLRTQEFANSQKLTFTDKASEDAGSASSKRARDIIRNTFGEDLPPTMSASEIYRNPKYRTALESVANSTGAALQEKRSIYNKYVGVDKTIDAAKAQLSNLGLKPAQFIANWIDRKITDTPELSALYAQLTLLPPGMVNGAESFDGLKKTVEALKSTAEADLAAASGRAPGSPNVGAKPPAKPGDQPPAKPGEAPKGVRMINKSTGKVIDNVDPSNVEELTRRGFVKG